MKVLNALLSGFAGACALTLIHQAARKNLEDAPRMDLLGMRAIAKGYEAAGETPPDEATLYPMSMAGDIVSNSLYYSLVGIGDEEGVWVRGAALGMAAGIGGVLLPKPLKLGSDASARTDATKAMTVAWYLLGGLAAAAAHRQLSSRR